MYRILLSLRIYINLNHYTYLKSNSPIKQGCGNGLCIAYCYHCVFTLISTTTPIPTTTNTTTTTTTTTTISDKSICPIYWKKYKKI